jgi:biofilm protein TabA
MILDRLEQLQRYMPLGKRFEKAVEFLAREDLNQLAAGKHEIDGDSVYAMVSRNPGRTREGARLEAHQQYVDIQVVLAGLDNIGWKSVSQCSQPDGVYIEQRDVHFFLDEPDVWVAVKPGSFAIFFPGDAHLPSVSTGVIHKIVVKVAVDRQ